MATKTEIGLIECIFHTQIELCRKIELDESKGYLHEKNVKCMKKMDFNVDRWLTTRYGGGMPSQRRCDKKQISVWIPIALFRKFQKRAESLGMTMTEIITAFLVQQTQNIELTPKDYEDIAKEIRKKTGLH